MIFPHNYLLYESNVFIFSEMEACVSDIVSFSLFLSDYLEIMFQLGNRLGTDFKCQTFGSGSEKYIRLSVPVLVNRFISNKYAYRSLLYLNIYLKLVLTRTKIL
jgi:hypothetical protein